MTETQKCKCGIEHHGMYGEICAVCAVMLRTQGIEVEAVIPEMHYYERRAVRPSVPVRMGGSNEQG